MKIILWAGHLEITTEVKIAGALGVKLHIYQQELHGEYFHKIKFNDVDSRRGTILLLEDAGKSKLKYEDLMNRKWYHFDIEEVRTNPNLIKYLTKNDNFDTIWVEDVDENTLFRIDNDEDGYESLTLRDSLRWFKFNPDGELVVEE